MLFYFCFQSFPASGTFPMSRLLPIRWPKFWSFSLSISPSNEYSGLISIGLTCLIPLLAKKLSRVFSRTTVKSIHSSVLSHLYGPTFISVLDYQENHSLTVWIFVGKMMSLLFNMLPRFVIELLLILILI